MEVTDVVVTPASGADGRQQHPQAKTAKTKNKKAFIQ